MLRHPVARIFFGLVFVATPVGLLLGPMDAAQGGTLGETPESRLFVNLATVILGYAGYVLFVKLFESRWPKEIGLKRVVPEFGGGLLLGSGLFSATMLLLWLYGYYDFAGFSETAISLDAYSIAIAGFFEELLVRGIIFRILEEILGTVWSLIASALLFGVMHLANPNAELWAGIALMLEAGLLLAACYVLTRRLWFAIGTHVAWNFTQGGIFGLAVSGHEINGLLSGVVTGPDWISGGKFGVEASVIAVAVCLAAFAIILRLIVKRGLVLNPIWARPRMQETQEHQL